jgi:hypothetical protein
MHTPTALSAGTRSGPYEILALAPQGQEPVMILWDDPKGTQSAISRTGFTVV